MQFQSDVLGLEVVRPASVETTSLGAAYLAGLAVGYWKDLDDVDDNWKKDRSFVPEMESSQRDKLLAGWKDAVKRAIDN